MLQDITRTIPAGEPSMFDVAGAGLTCIAANLPDFAIRFDNDPEATFRVGFEYAPPEGFDRFEVINTRAVALTVTFTVWQGLFRDRRQISSAPQSYRPVTIEDARDKGFAIYGSASGDIGLRPVVGLFNPPGSARVIVLTQLFLLSTVAVRASFLAIDATFGGLLANSYSLFLGEPSGVAQLLSDVANPPGTTLFERSLAANVTTELRFDQPFIIPAGRGIAVPGAINSTLDFDATFLELAG